MDLWDGTHVGRSEGTQRSCTRSDYDAIVQQFRTIQGATDDVTLQSTGAAETISGLAVTEYGDGAFHKTVFTLTALALISTDGVDAPNDGAWATDVLYTFPAGSKLLIASGFDFDLANVAGDDGFTDTADFDIGLGSVAVAPEVAFSLTGTLSDYGDATVALVGGVKTGQAASVVTAAEHTARTLNLNVRTVDDADHGAAAGSLLVTGTGYIIWSMLK